MSDISTDPVVDPAVPADQVVVDPATEADLFDNAGTDTFPRAYVEKLRNENAKTRTDYAPYRDTFADVDADLRDYVLNDVIKPLLGEDPSAALDELYDLVERIHAGNKSVPRWLAQEVAKAEEAADPNAPMTEARWREIQAKEAADHKQAEGIKSILDEAESLGYVRDAKLDKYGDLASLFQISTTQTKGDLKAAHALREARFAEAVEQALEVRLQEIKDGTRKWAPVAATGASPAEAKDEPKTFAEARQRANARMNRYFQD